MKCNSLIFLVSLFIVGILVIGCQSDTPFEEYRTSIDPAISTNIVRYDQMLFNLDRNNLLDDYKAKTQKMKAFSEVHDQGILGLEDDLMLEKELINVTSDSSYENLYLEIQNTLGDLSRIKPAIDQTLVNYLEVAGLPADQMPDVYTFLSGFVYQTLLFDDMDKDGIGLSLDMFLGSDFPYEQIQEANPQFSSYLVRTYNEDHIPRKIAEVLAEDLLGPPEKADFLSLMMWGGKKLYLIDQMISFAPDSIVTQYSQDQLTWCRGNESQIWSFFFEQDLFYETDLRKFNKLISPAPTSPGMPPESPGETANYMGWQVVKAFIKRFPETTTRELITKYSAQEILDLSKYKPVR